MSEFISKTDLVEELGELRRRVKKGAKRKEVLETLTELWERGQVDYSSSIRETGLEEIRKAIREYPGITFRELSEELARSVNWCKTAVAKMDDVEPTPRHDKKGMYGRKPDGLYLTDTP